MADFWSAHWIEVLGFVTGAACVILAGRRSVWTFPVGIANTALFLWLFTDARLYADAGLQVVFMVLGVTGWIGWLRARGAEAAAHLERDEAFVVRAPRQAWPAVVLVGAVGTAGLAWLLTEHTNSTSQLPDAATTVGSLIAQFMLNRRWVESWLVWIVVDVAYVGLYISRDLHITAVLYAGFIAVCVVSWRSWRRLPTAPDVMAAADAPSADPRTVAARG